MCYAKPGPRCAKHAKEDIRRAARRLKANPQDKDAESAWVKANQDYLTSKEGIKESYEKAENTTDPELARIYRRDADAWAFMRKEKLAAYNRVKHLPVERREWEYDEHGYADPGDVEEANQGALRFVHSDAYDYDRDGDYLVKNGLTELNGWTTDRAEGEEEKPVELGTSLYGVPLKADVRSVKLKNIISGEERKVYRLNTGDGYSTHGSRQEAEEAALANADEFARRYEKSMKNEEYRTMTEDSIGGMEPLTEEQRAEQVRARMSVL